MSIVTNSTQLIQNERSQDKIDLSYEFDPVKSHLTFRFTGGKFFINTPKYGLKSTKCRFIYAEVTLDMAHKKPKHAKHLEYF